MSFTKSSSSKNLYLQYREFTQDHASLFTNYEDVIMAYYKKQGVKNPEKKLNTLRTAFANKISNDAAKMRPDLFCYRYAPRIEKVSTMNKGDIREWASTFFPSHPVSQPMCH